MNLQSSSQPLTSHASALHRCFYAVRFSQEVTSYLASIITELKRHRTNVRWIPERNIHLTLRFLGEINDAQLAKACELIEAEQSFKGISLCARGLGAFPLLRAPRVIWAGVDGETRADLDHLHVMQKHTEEWARRIGVQPEQRSYTPHITLGRVARPFEGLKELMDDIIGRECQSALCRVGEVVLMRSTLSSGGASYETIAQSSSK